jgi:NNP family nitrate/nitrite transporter-like MFS transporter
LLGAFLYFDVSFMVWMLLGALGNYIAADLGLGPAQKGLMTALPLLSGAVLRLLFGQLTETWSAKRTGSLGLAITALPLLGGWLWADSLGAVFAVGVLLGVAGASFAVALPLASRWYPKECQGLVMGLAGAGNSGTLLATLFAPRLAETHGWHAVFGLALAPLAFVALAFGLFAKDAPEAASQSRSTSQTPPAVAGLLAVLKERDAGLFSLFYAVTFGGFVGLASFLSIFLHDQYGVSRVRAGDLASLCVLAGSFLRPVGGRLADRFGGIRLLSALYGAIALLALGAAQLPALGVAVILFVALMACLGLGNGAVFQLVPQRFGERVGVATGILGAAGGLGGFCLPTAFGLLKQLTGSYASGLALVTGLAVVALATLAVAQGDWIGVWIAKHGRAKRAVPVPEMEEAPT